MERSTTSSSTTQSARKETQDRGRPESGRSDEISMFEIKGRILSGVHCQMPLNVKR